MARLSKSNAFIYLLVIAYVIILIIIIAMLRSHDNRGTKWEAYVQEPYRFPSDAAEICAELRIHPPPDHPGEEVMALCDALLLKLFDSIKGRDDLISPLMEDAAKVERFVNKTEEASDGMEEARIFQTLLVMTDWSSK